MKGKSNNKEESLNLFLKRKNLPSRQRMWKAEQMKSGCTVLFETYTLNALRRTEDTMNEVLKMDP
jgi:hypothetical protein